MVSIKHATLTSELAANAKISAAQWDAEHDVDIAVADVDGLQTALDAKAPTASPTFTGTVSGITKAMVGLGNADNTSDANKPVSTAQQAALDLKAPLASPTFTGTPASPTATGGTNTTQLATAAFVQQEIRTGGAAAGTSFPVSPTSGDRFFRTDRRIQYSYDGTRWLSTHAEALAFQPSSGGVTADTVLYAPVPYAGTYSIWLEGLSWSRRHSIAADTWNLVLNYITAAFGATLIHTIDGTADTSTNVLASFSAIGAELNANAKMLQVVFDEIVDGATLISAASLHYRLIG